MAESVPAADLTARVSHLADTVLNEAGHSFRHLEAAKAAGSPESLEYNLAHLDHHLGEVIEHGRKLVTALAEFDPAGVGAETGRLREVTREYEKGWQEARARFAAGSLWEDPLG
jgi:hypothetical protein